MTPERLKALTEGRIIYHGAPCQKCGGTERRANRGCCAACIREREKLTQKRLRAEKKVKDWELIQQRDELLAVLELLLGALEADHPDMQLRAGIAARAAINKARGQE